VADWIVVHPVVIRVIFEILEVCHLMPVWGRELTDSCASVLREHFSFELYYFASINTSIGVLNNISIHFLKKYGHLEPTLKEKMRWRKPANFEAGTSELLAFLLIND